MFGPVTLEAWRDRETGTVQVDVSTTFVSAPNKAITVREAPTSGLSNGSFLLLELTLTTGTDRPNPKVDTKKLPHQPLYGHVVLIYGTDVVAVASVVRR
jgi:hypothetical protein